VRFGVFSLLIISFNFLNQAPVFKNSEARHGRWRRLAVESVEFPHQKSVGQFGMAANRRPHGHTHRGSGHRPKV
jgi:hypothetical protein